jgi:C4-dicarboxylate-binding protein DctP
MRRNFKVKTYALIAFLAVLFLMLNSGCAGKQQKQDGQTQKQTKPIVIRWSYDTPQGGTLSIVPEKFKELVEADESLKGRVEVQLYPSSQLYKPQEALDAVMRGDVEFILLGHWYLSSLSPKISIIDLPFLFKDIPSVNAFLNSPEAKEAWAPLESRGIKFVAGAATGSYGLINNKREVVFPEDVKGLKIRSTGDGSILWQKLGGSAVNLPAGDVYVAMQRGTIDGADLGPISIKERNLFEVSKYYLDTLIHTTIVTQIVNKKFWDGLPADIQEKFWKHLKEAERSHQEAVPKLEKEYVEKMKAKGVKVHSLIPTEKEKWIEAVRPVYDELGPKIGQDLIEKVRALQK